MKGDPNHGPYSSVKIFIALRLWQNSRHFAYDIFKCILFNEDLRLFIEISPNFIQYATIGSYDGLAPNRQQNIV